MPTVLEFPGKTEVINESLTWPERARAAIVTNDDTYQTACGLLLGIKSLRNKIAETFDPHVKRAHEAHKALVEEKRNAEAPLGEAERILKGSILAYDRIQELARQEEQRRLDEEARRQEETARLERATAMETEGHEYGDPALIEEAHALINQQSRAVAAPVQKSTPKVAGISMRRTFNFRITNAALVPAQYKVIDEVKIRGVVRALGAQTNIPGVQVYEETGVAAGRR